MKTLFWFVSSNTNEKQCCQVFELPWFFLIYHLHSLTVLFEDQNKNQKAALSRFFLKFVLILPLVWNFSSLIKVFQVMHFLIVLNKEVAPLWFVSKRWRLEQHWKSLKTVKRYWPLFVNLGFTGLKFVKSLWGLKLIWTTKFLGIPDTHIINLRRMDRVRVRVRKD